MLGYTSTLTLAVRLREREGGWGIGDFSRLERRAYSMAVLGMNEELFCEESVCRQRCVQKPPPDSDRSDLAGFGELDEGNPSPTASGRCGMRQTGNLETEKAQQTLQPFYKTICFQPKHSPLLLSGQ